MRDIDGKLMTAVQASMNMCKHFTGVQNEHCDKGVSYSSVRVRSQLKAAGIPCLKDSSLAGGKCSQAAFMTLTEATTKHEAYKARQKSINEMICPDCGATLIDNRLTEGKHKGHGTIDCSVCNKWLVMI